MKLMCAFLLLLAQTPETPNQAKTLNDSRFTNVALRINGDNELRVAHMGYWDALQSRPEWAEQEALWWQLMQTADLGPLLARADEVLQKDAKSQDLYDGFYLRLAVDDDLRRNFEQFERTGLVQRGDIRQWQAALQFFRSNPTAAAGLLDGLDASEALPEALRPFASELMNTRSWEALRASLEQLGLNSGTVEALQPWWEQAAALDAANGGVFSSLALHFAQHPQRFWAAYRRELALAKEPQLRDWVRWWHRRMRRAEVDYTDYLGYLTALREGREAAPDKPQKTWPPGESPPAVEGLPTERLPAPEAAKEHRTTSIVRSQTARPEVKRPERPQKPERPKLRESELLKERAKE